MNRLTRLVALGILIGSCSGLGITDPDSGSYTCTPYAPDTIITRWPDSLTLVLGSADEVRVERGIEDGCSYLSLPFASLTIGTRDSSVATTAWVDRTGATVLPENSGRSWVVLEAPGLADSIPVSVPDTFALGNVSALAAGGLQSCAVEDTGQVYCWGADIPELLGRNAFASVGTCYGTPCSPMPVPIGIEADEVYLGQGLACFLDAAGTSCWRWGELESLTSFDLVSITIGPNHRCGLNGVGDAYCWGLNDVGQLGTGLVGRDERSPTPIRSSLEWASLHAAETSTCGVTVAGHLYCWGLLPENVAGAETCELPAGKSSDPVFAPCADEPLRIPVGDGPSSDTLLTQVAGPCVLTTAGGVLCAPEGSTRFERVAEAGSFVVIRAGVRHHCGLTAEGSARCWGINDQGQLGTGTRSQSLLPVTVAGAHTFTDIALGSGHSCGLTDAQEVWCWGENYTGQAGGSILETPLVPTKVRGQGSP